MSERGWPGLAISGQGGLGTSYDDDWIGPYFLKDFSLFYLGVTPSYAYRANDRVSLAGSISMLYAGYSQNSAVLNPEPGLGDGEVELETDDLAPGWGVSAMFRVGSATRFGLSYRSEVEPDLEDVPSFSNLGPTREQQFEASGALDRPIGVQTRLPQSTILGVHHRFGDGRVLTADLAWLDFSSFELSQSLVTSGGVETQPTSYNDIWLASLRMRFPLRDPWELRVGGFYVSDAVDDPDRTFLLRLDDAVGIGAGFKRAVGGRKTLTVNLTLIEVGDAPVKTRDMALIGQITGQYKTRHTTIVNVGLNWRSRSLAERSTNSKR